ncbi:MAG: glycosyltransferase family 4 protein, partial [Caldilineales bacterium]|nr:glycosyltransferase family 4 protein [Caldilineales bacterium]
MRVLFDATPLQTGHRHRGIGAYARHLLQALLAVDRETEYLLVAHPGPPLGLDLAAARARLITLPRPSLGRLTAFVTHQALLPAVFLRVRADLFHSPGFTAAFSVPGIPWRCPMPLVVTLHDFIPLHVPALSLHKPVNRAWYAWQRRLARRAAALICVSEATRQEALRYVGAAADRLVVVHEGVDRRVFRPRGLTERPGEGLPAALPSTARPYILFVGGDYPNKNRPAALAAFSRIVQATTLPHHLVLVGPDHTSAPELAERYPGLDLRRVHRLAEVTGGELAALYRQADAFLFPSTHEGFGLPLLEAMA